MGSPTSPLPDGTKIAVAQSRLGKQDGFDIWVYDASGKGAKLMGQASINLMPDWSPDGSMIAFTYQDGHGFHVGIVRSNGAAVDKTFPGLAPSWSPDGRWLAVSDAGLALVEWASGRTIRVPLPDGFAIGGVDWAAPAG